MTAAERQQLRRDRVKSGLVRIEVWVPADRVAAVRDAIDEALYPPTVSADTLRAIRSASDKAARAQDEAAKYGRQNLSANL